MKDSVFYAKRPNNLKRIAGSIIKIAGNDRIVAFYGQMGVGKTTLIRFLCQRLGVRAIVTSPTFTLVNEYPSDNGPVFHFDFYRISKASEVLDLGIDECFDSGHWCLIEWPELVEELLPETVVKVILTENPCGSRTIRVEIEE
ncbi:MAG: tRNA (adenosine(37)-N6)-threonylcarbamoyltransferase complex ATPase subunit type 1 TsaE [Bacteroidia bacterium]|nr:tRNA (adenosine(37)-N6)-threonylcarbamoyltransferase complex ATPase subunit type 1 TsaE [Bacteroidia bacterium]